MLVGAGLFIQVVQTFRVLRNLMKQHWMPPLAESPRWLALNVAAPVFIAVLLFALERRQGWARPGLLIVTFANFAELCWQVGWLYRRSPDDMSLLLLPSFLIVRVLPLVLYMVALHLLYSRNKQ